MVGRSEVLLVRVNCYWCDKGINRSPSALVRVSHVFCSRTCKLCYERMKRDLVSEAEEQDRISRSLNNEMDLVRERYGGNG